jgi:hypothetical protein
MGKIVRRLFSFTGRKADPELDMDGTEIPQPPRHGKLLPVLGAESKEAGAGRCDNAKLGEMGADRIDSPRSVGE